MTTVLSLPEVRAGLAEELISERTGTDRAFTGITNDSRTAAPGELFFALTGEDRDGHEFTAAAVAAGVAGVVVHREIDVPGGVTMFRVRNTQHALGNLASFWRDRFSVRSVVITGNVGKTTTKELTAAVLASRYEVLRSPANFNDEIGLSMTLFHLDGRHQRAVLEAGMFQLGEIRRLCEIAKPEIAVVLNVGPTHMERLGSLEAIAAAKAEAVEELKANGTAILNFDDPYVKAMASKTRARILPFGLGDGDGIRGRDIVSRGFNGVDFMVEANDVVLEAHTPLPGRDLVRNALAAIAVAVSDGFSLPEAVAALRAARVEARLKVRRSANGTTILDDTYNASPASMLAALDVLAETPGRHLAFLGDMLELGAAEEAGHRAVGERAAAVGAILFTTGERARGIAAAARSAGAPAVMHFESKDDALAAIEAELRPGDAILIKASHGMAFHTVAEKLADS